MNTFRIVCPEVVGLGGGGAAAGYDPASDANVIAWWKADSLALSDGATVTAWTDSSGHGWTVEGINTPIYKASIQNGKPIVRCDGVDDFLQMAAALGTPQAQPYTLFVAFKIFTTGALHTILDGYPGGRTCFQIYPSTTWNHYCGTNDASMGTSNTNWNIAMLEVNGASSRYKFNGSSAATYSVTPGSNSVAQLIFGCAIGPSQFGQVDIGEVIWRSGTSASIQADAFTYLTNRWGYTAASAVFAGNHRIRLGSGVADGTQGMTDGSQFTLSMWLRPAQVGSLKHILQGRTGDSGPQWRIEQGSGDQWGFFNSSLTNVCGGSIGSSFTVNNWYHLLFSFNLTSTSTRHCYVNGVSATGLSWSTYNTSGTMVFNLGNLFVGNNDSFEVAYSGDMAEVWIDDIYRDFSVQSNREKFALAGQPQDLGSNGSTPFGAAPNFYLRFLSGALGVNSGANGGTGVIEGSGSITSGSTTVQY